MFTPLDWANNRYKRLNRWQGGSFRDGLTMLFNCRHSGWGHCMYRLPLLVVWTMFVIFILYRSISSPSDSLQGDTSEGRQHTLELNAQQALRWTTAMSPVIDSQETTTLDVTTLASADKYKSELTAQLDSFSKPSAVPTSPNTNTSESRLPVLSTTRKSPVSEYIRHSEVFILIIQDEDIKSKTQQHNNGSPRVSLNLYPSNKIGVASSTRAENVGQKLVIPSHINELTEILESSRIGFTIDTTRHGMPSQLLDSQSSPKKYSVIIIDDFVKYTKLNRWLRDQLDRYCRTNRIGVISYLIDSNNLHEQQLEAGGTAHSHTLRTHQSNPAPKLITSDQFPLSFEPIQLDCRNASSVRCLINYQLNDKSEVLRILKPRLDFIVGGQVSASSVVAMSSNHVTYEPLTWAKLRLPRSARAAVRHKRLAPATGRSNKLVDVGTRLANHRMGVSHVQKRAVLPSRPTTASSTMAYFDALNSDERSVMSDSKQAVTPSSDDMMMMMMTAEDDLPNSNVGHQEFDENNFSDQPHLEHPQSPRDFSGGERKILSMLDHGLYDDIKRVIFGVTNQQIWLDRVLLLDVIEHLSSGEIMTPLDRYIQIDIDDIFVGSTGTRLHKEDVEALIEAQNEFGQLFVDGFQYQLGFSGKYFKHGNEAEQAGDEHLIKNADKFTWFCHFWSHSKAHLFNDTETLALELKRNLEFARTKRLTLVGHSGPLAAIEDRRQPMSPSYAVAPHHSGVYPIHEQLYEAWSSILNVQVTSTEEYPHLRPASRRRGFVHKTIKVLPRQTCGLYTHTIFKDKYPGGFGKLLANIRGGELFQTVLHNPVNIYMTHMSNYANDRLGLLTFRELFKFIKENTNLRLRFAPTRTSGDIADAVGPMFLANYYFSLHPFEVEPLWTNPCDDKRHLAIWSPGKLALCQVAPRVLIVGPQKTGTTALQWFLELNPSIRTSVPSAHDFEEVQFFNDKHYFKGSDWYLGRFGDYKKAFKHEDHKAASVYLDKSATYFDDPKVARRASSLLPQAHVIIILINPADRAYSWYQHIRAHGDNEAALEMTFDEVIMFEADDNANDADDRLFASSVNSSTASRRPTIGGQPLKTSRVAAIKSLRARCLGPGYYSSHLLKWLDYYPARQIIIIDGEWFKYNPMAVLNRLQLLLRLPQQVDYNHLLAYSQAKGFYCERTQAENMPEVQRPKHRNDDDAVRCLGSGKGRKYEPMSEQARGYLERHYLAHNRQLAKLLYEIGQPLPTWLDESINSLPASLSAATTRRHRK